MIQELNFCKIAQLFSWKKILTWCYLALASSYSLIFLIFLVHHVFEPVSIFVFSNNLTWYSNHLFSSICQCVFMRHVFVNWIVFNLSIIKAGLTRAKIFYRCTIFWILFCNWQLRKRIQITVQLENFLSLLILWWL